MGRNGDGVRVRETSIEIGFTREGRFERHTLMIDGRALAPTVANVKYARRLAAEIREKLRHGTFSLVEYFPASGKGPAPLTVATQLDTWLSTERVEASTRRGYRAAIRFWTARIGERPIRALKPSDIEAASAQCGLSGKTVNNYMSVLRAALELAVRDKALAENPAAGIKAAAHQKPDVDPFTPEERDKLLAEAARRFPASCVNLLEFWFWTGLRTSELIALRWEHVDLASGHLVVSEAVVAGRRKGTKTNRSRKVLLNSRALAALQRQREHTQLAGAEVWIDPRSGAPWKNEQNIRRTYWRSLFPALGIRYRRPYNCRHTYATAMLMVGMTPAFCARQLGHSVEMFLRVYARWLDGARDDAEMARLEAEIGRELDEKGKGARRSE